MNFVLQPWQLLLAIFAGWVNRQQQEAIEYLLTENAVLREKLGRKRILLSDDQRRRLAVKGKLLGRRMLGEIATLFTPDTIVRWHRELIARKWDYSARRRPVGRPPLAQSVVDLVLRFAGDNPTWGYDRIQGALANLGHDVSDTTVANVLKAHGIESAPDRRRTSSWSTFLKSHWDVLAAIDFTTVEVWTLRGLVTYHLLFVIEPRTRRVCFAGCTPNPDEVWMKQVARNLVDELDGFLLGTRYLLMDRDGKFCRAFRDSLAGAGVEPVLLPPRSPNLNAYVERFVRSVKEECLERMIFFGERPLRRAVREYLEHYHGERNHQGLGNQLVDGEEDRSAVAGTVVCRERLGGLLKYYQRAA